MSKTFDFRRVSASDSRTARRPHHSPRASASSDSSRGSASSRYMIFKKLI